MTNDSTSPTAASPPGPIGSHMRASSTMVLVTASTTVAATRSVPALFAAFAHPTPNVSPARPSTKRWKLVSPSPCKRKHDDPDIKSPKVKKKKKGPSTVSFDALTAANFPSLMNKNIEMHTLILGTHPSIKSLAESQYFGHPMNAFWWIAGDCLGFRRADAISKSTGRPYKFSTFLRHENINTYQQQTELFCSKGFALWDIVQSCERPGSLDQDITKDQPNDIRAFCRVHPSIRRIVFANGGTGCKFFKKHFKDWLDTGELTPSTNKASQDVLKKWAGKPASSSQQPTIECVVALAVSPAAAKFTYEEKRDFWDEFVYNPGLKDFEKSQTQK